MTKNDKVETRGRKPLYSQAMVPVPLTMPEDMRDALDAYIDGQNPPPSRSALMRAVLSDWLQAVPAARKTATKR